jgi:SAM-dependent methyltransferase
MRGSGDFIFKEVGGEFTFVGDFEGYYKADLDPWDQSGAQGAFQQYYNRSRGRLAGVIQHMAPEGIGLEVGCGHGHAAWIFSCMTGRRCDGMDISPTAIERAKLAYPQLHFACGDIRDPLNVGALGYYSFVMLNQIFWYVIKEIDVVVANCRDLLVHDGILIFCQGFLNHKQRYGAEIAEGYSGALKLFTERYRGRFEIIYADPENAMPSDPLVLQDGLIVMRKIYAH